MAVPIINLSYLNGSNGFRIKGELSGFHFGISVSSAGDMNGDGFDDVMVGSQFDYPPSDHFGRSYVVFGKASGFDATLDIGSLNGNNGFRLSNESFASPPFNTPFLVSDAGDVNGDGFDDVIIGAQGFYSSFTYTSHKGAGYVVFGKPGGFPPDLDLSHLNGNDGFRLDVARSEDVAVSGGGDINGDGLDDVIISARWDGASYVVFGKTSGFDATLDLTRLNGSDGFRLEGVVATVNNAVDINGDGFDDVSVGLDNQNAGYVLYGKASGFDPVVSLDDVDGTNGFHFSDESSNLAGVAVNEAGDINGDGIDDLSIGNNVLLGRTAGFTADVDLSSLDGSNGFRIAGGGVVSNVGDLTGDGIDDVMVDARYVLFGKTSGFDAIFDLSSLDGSNGFKVEGGGGAFNGAGDVNNDGFDDLIIGKSSPGVSYVVFGGPFIPDKPIYSGTAGDDQLTGTILAERFDGGDGNDVINGLGGADVLEGGGGDDTFPVVDFEFERMNGGSGNDTLQLTGDLDLNLADVHEKIGGIETINLGGSGENTLTLAFTDLLGLSDTANIFTINGNTTDRVIGLSSGWADGGLDQGYRLFTQNGITLRVHNAVPTDASKRGVINLSDLNGANGFRLDGAVRDHIGASVSNAGDINGDGFDDVIVGGYVPGYVVFGKAAGFDAAQDLNSLDGSDGFQLIGLSPAIGSGFSVSDAGDVNGDGFDDLIIGSHSAKPNGDFSGASYMLFGKASGFNKTVDLSKLDGRNGFRLDGETEFDFLGRSVSSAGDMNGDGFDDVIIGANSASPSVNVPGASYVIFGKSSGFEASIGLSSLNGKNGFRLDGATADDEAGMSVSNVGDVNGDGFDDVIIGAPFFRSSDGAVFGASYVVFGKASGLPASLNLANLDGSNGFRIDGSGGAISGAGDVNGDGFDDVIGAAPADPDGIFSGGSYVLFGKAAEFDATVNLSTLNGNNGFRLEETAADDQAGASVSSAGDVNGDGFDDVIIGAPGANVNAKFSGSNYVVFGKASGFDASLNLWDLDGSNGFQLTDLSGKNGSGGSVSGAGDVNGDGFDDLLVSAPNANSNGIYSGSSYIVFGRSNFSNGNVIAGTPGDDVLRGTSDADIFEAGDGNDLMIGRGGADVFHGGKGVDHIKVTDLNFRQIDGGTGNDVLHTDGKDLSLDLTDYLDKIQGIETICLYGRGDNTLTLTGRELEELSDTTNTLKVHGNAGDQVILEGTWVDGGSHGFYHTYTQDDAVLLVGMNMAVVFA